MLNSAWKTIGAGIRRLISKSENGVVTLPQKTIRATAAKEVGMKNPAEKTAVRPNQNPGSILPVHEFPTDTGSGP
jgi:hypothetical protein